MPLVSLYINIVYTCMVLLFLILPYWFDWINELNWKFELNWGVGILVKLICPIIYLSYYFEPSISYLWISLELKLCGMNIFIFFLVNIIGDFRVQLADVRFHVVVDGQTVNVRQAFRGTTECWHQYLESRAIFLHPSTYFLDTYPRY